jgi:hypothetical protein
MSITERLKGAQDMKNLQAELIEVQMQSQERQAQMEPLQELAEYYHAIGGGKEEHGASIGKVRRNDPGGDQSASIRGDHEKSHAGPNTRKGTYRKVPQSSRGGRGSTQILGGSGRATCQYWGHVGHRPILGKRLFLERKARSGRMKVGRKSNTYKLKLHAKEESM